MNKSTIESRVDWTKVSKRVGELSIFIYFSRSESERERRVSFADFPNPNSLLCCEFLYHGDTCLEASRWIGEKKKFDKLLDLMKNSAFFWLPIYKIQLGNERNSKIR